MTEKTYLLFALVSFENTILAQRQSPIKHKLVKYRDDVKRAAEVGYKVLDKICAKDMHDHKKSFVSKKFSYHYIIDNGMVYMCATQTGHPQKLAFTFLRDIRDEWEQMYSRFDCVRAGPEQMTHSFKPILTKKMMYYSEQMTTRVKEVTEQVEDVKGILVQNLEKVLKRGDNLEMVEFNANQMAEKTGQFKKVSKKLKKKKFWGLIKWKVFCLIALGILVIVVVYLLGTLVCGGWKWDNCLSLIAQLFH